MRHRVVIAAALMAALAATSGAHAGSAYRDADGQAVSQAALRNDQALPTEQQRQCLVSRRAAAQYKTYCRFPHI